MNRKKFIVLSCLLWGVCLLLLLGLLRYTPPAPTPQHTVELYRTALRTTVTLPLEDYLWGVLAGEMPASYPLEALKAQAVASYTYLSHRRALQQAYPERELGHAGEVCDDPAHCKAYLSPAEAEAKWGGSWLRSAQDKLKQAVEAVWGKVLFYGESPANTVFHAISGGRTESAADVWGADIPYLRSVDSHWDREAGGFRSTVTFTAAELRERLGLQDHTPGSVTLTAGGSVDTQVLGSTAFTGRQLREQLGLRSTRFTVEACPQGLTFTVSGYGHQVGMSQHGASVLAGEGYGYEEILAYYYPGTRLCENYFV